MTALAALGMFAIAACTAIWKAYQFFLNQFERRREEIRAEAVKEYVEKNTLEELQAAVLKIQQKIERERGGESS